MQSISFCLLFFSGDVVAFPYAIYLWHAVPLFMGYGITGAIGIACCLIALMPSLRFLQLTGLLAMLVSIAWFLINSIGNLQPTFMNVLSWLTFLLFAVVCYSVVVRFVKIQK